MLIFSLDIVYFLRIHIMKLFIVLISPACCYFVPVRSKYSPHCSVLKHSPYLPAHIKILALYPNIV